MYAGKAYANLVYFVFSFFIILFRERQSYMLPYVVFFP